MMDIRKIIDEAVAVLRDGGVILYPTDTVWGIGCDACNEKAVEKVFAIKHRAGAKSLIVLASDLDMVAKYVREIPSVAIDLVEVNDAPMTIIYPGAQYLAPNVVAEDGSVGIRIPLALSDAPESDGGAFCRELTSANVSGNPSPLSFDEIPQEILSAVDYVVPKACGRNATGRASQIIKLGLKGEVEVIRP